MKWMLSPSMFVVNWGKVLAPPCACTCARSPRSARVSASSRAARPARDQPPALVRPSSSWRRGDEVSASSKLEWTNDASVALTDVIGDGVDGADGPPATTSIPVGLNPAGLDPGLSAARPRTARLGLRLMVELAANFRRRGVNLANLARFREPRVLGGRSPLVEMTSVRSRLAPSTPVSCRGT